MSDDGSAARTLRIAANISASEWGGAERRSLVLLAALAARGHDVRVFCNTEFIAERAREVGLEAVVSPLRGDIMLHHALALAARLRAHRPHVLILVTFRRLLTGALAGRLAGVPRMIARIGLASDIARSAKYRFVLKHWIDDVVVNAASLVGPFEASLARGSRVRVTVIPNGVEPRPAAASGDDVRSELGIPADAFVIGTVARLVKQKRIDRLIRVVHALCEHDVHAMIAGAGYELEPLSALVSELGVAHRVHLLGHREDVGTIHAALDLYLVTSDQEGMSSGMLEALAAGLPVVSTPVSGAREVLQGEPQCGVIAEPSPESLAHAVLELLHDPERRQELAAGARQVVEARYGVARMVDAWESMLGGGS